jgi:ribosome-associated protein
MRYTSVMIRITPAISIDETELSESFMRSSGPGGQNVNKVSTAVELRFNAVASPNLSDEVKARLLTLAGQRATKDGVVIITSDTHRSQERNRQEALTRLKDLIVKAAFKPKRRIPTKPSRSSQAKRVDSKVKAGRTKKLRQDKSGGD